MFPAFFYAERLFFFNLDGIAREIKQYPGCYHTGYQ